MKSILSLLVFISILTSFSFGQIQIGGDQPKSTKTQKQKAPKTPKSDTANYDLKVFLGTTIASTYRTLAPAKDPLFAEELGSRVDEVSKAAWSYHLGFSNDINRFMMWEAGISWLRNHEQYLYTVEGDTTHNYTSKYSWIGMPIKLYFKYDFKKVRFVVGGGFSPQIQMKFRKDEVFVDSYATETTNKIKTINGMNTFGISAIANIGIHYNITNRFGLYLTAEYRHQLTNSHTKTFPYIHKGTAIGANFGLAFGI